MSIARDYPQPSPYPRAPYDPPPTPPARGGLGRAFAGSMVGAVLEWYDFALYGVLAATVLGGLFFPGSDPGLNVLLALGTHGIGFLARPLGGVVLGHLADRHGRRAMLVVTFVMIGSATAGIGLLPTYDDIGIVATILLVTLRLVQGFALGGEFGAAVVLVGEHAPPRRRGLWTSWPQTGGPAGTLLATGVVTLSATLTSAEQFEQWGWRLGFLIAIPLLLLGIWLRKGIDESGLLSEVHSGRQARGVRGRVGVPGAFTHSAALTQGLLLRVGENIAYYFYTAFVVGYATKSFDYTQDDVLMAVTFAAAFQFIGMILGGWWSDYSGRRAAMITPAIILVLWSPAFFHLVSLESLPALWIGVGVGAFFHGMLAGPEAAWLVERFPTHCRSAGSSLVFQGSSIFAGAPAPFLALWLIDLSGIGAVSVCLMLTTSLAAVAVSVGPETRGCDLRET